MRKIIVLFVLFSGSVLHAQLNPVMIYAANPPTGPCVQPVGAQLVIANGLIYSCLLQSDSTFIWGAIGSSSSGGVKSFSSGNLSPLLTTSVANSTTDPVQSFSLLNASPFTVFGNCTGTASAPSYCSLTSGMLPSTVPTYPAAGIANSTGTAWGTPYGVSGTGTTVALTNGPTFTTIIANSYIGQFGSVYGTLALGSGSGGTIEKTISDGTPVIVASLNGATTGTGDFYAVKDSSGTPHTVVDHSLGLHGTSAALGSSGQTSIDSSGSLGIGYTGTLPLPWPVTVGTTGQFHSDASGNVRGTTFNGIALATGGPTTSYLGQDGTYHALPASSNGFPITIGTTSIAANSTNTVLSGLTNIVLSGATATPDQNFNSGSLAFTGSFDDAGPVPQTWAMLNIMGSGLTPTSTLSISPIPGGTTGSRIFQVSADEEILENGAGIVHVTGNSAYMGVSATGVSVGPSDVTISGATSSGNVLLNAGATGLVIASRPIRMPVASFVNGGSTINLNAPAGGSGTFTQNVTAENGDLQPCPTGTPNVTLGSASGTPANGATVSVLGTNCGGMVTVKTGSDTTSQAYIFTLTFANPFTHYGFCTFSPSANVLQDPGITPDNVYMSTGLATGFSLGLSGTGVMEGLANHQWSYTCNGY